MTTAGDGGDFGDFTAAPAARAKDADVDRLVSAAVGALRANWTLLDGVERLNGR
jgi:hypothetical protein